jgi:hypothetical protein
VALGCKDYESGRDTIVDIIKVTTPAINYSVNVTRVALDSVHFTLQLDANYPLDQTNPAGAASPQPQAVLYGIGSGGAETKLASIPISVGAAVQGSGWASSITPGDANAIQSGYSNFAVRLEDTYYQGRQVVLQSGIYSPQGTTFSVNRTFNVAMPDEPSDEPSAPSAPSRPDAPTTPDVPDVPADNSGSSNSSASASSTSSVAPSSVSSSSSSSSSSSGLPAPPSD